MFCQGDIIEWYLNNALIAFEIQDKCGKKPLEILKLSGEELYDEVKEVYKDLTQNWFTSFDNILTLIFPLHLSFFQSIIQEIIFWVDR